MAFKTSTLLRAIRKADHDLLRRALESGTPLNRVNGNHTTALCVAVDCEEPDEKIVQMLAGRGCSLFGYDRQGENALQIARRRGHDAIVDLLLDPSIHGGPQWHRDAIELGGPLLAIMVTRGAGFGFAPDDVEAPFRAGGTYDGFGFPLGPDEGKALFDELCPQHPERLEWFAPYLESIVRGEDFDLGELIDRHADDIQNVYYAEGAA